MEFTTLILLILGVAGILLHNLIALDKLNRSCEGKTNLIQYLRIEVFSIAASFIIVIVSLILAQQINKLYNAGYLLGFGFVGIGYMGQSLFVWAMARLNKVIKK